MEYDFCNLGVLVSAGELKNAKDDLEFNNKLHEKLQNYIDRIGYKKRLEDDNNIFDQNDAWNIEIEFIKKSLLDADVNDDVYVLFEYMLPNENTIRPDIILLYKNKVAIFELKAIGRVAKPGYVVQFLDYKKIIKGYHFESNGLEVDSYLVMCSSNNSNISISDAVSEKMSDDDKACVIGQDGFGNILRSFTDLDVMPYDDVIKWINSKRKPNKSVAERSKQLKEELKNGPEGLYSKVSDIPFEHIEGPVNSITEIRKKAGKKIIFVSGVPGAGKTLVGLIALFSILGEDANNVNAARYYSGNGALVNVLQGALDSKSDVALLMGLRNNCIIGKNICEESVLIFDEAQRFWSREKVKSECERKREYNVGDPNFEEYLHSGCSSDAEGIINIDYSDENVTLICLVGDGQKPMNGEAGIEAWIEALKNNSTWKVYIPKEKESLFSGINYSTEYPLHLNVSQRAHFVNLGPWVEAVLQRDFSKAKEELKAIRNNENKFNIRITRSLGALYSHDQVTKTYLEKIKEKHEIGEERAKYLFGVLCSSNKYSAEPGSYITTKIKKLSEGILYEEWDESKYITNLYINNDMAYNWYEGECCNRSCVAATETFCQGLEIDLPVLFFRGDYILKKNGAGQYEWTINISERKKIELGDEYDKRIEDVYRILLTRATEEMILVIPNNREFDDMYDFFVDMGINLITESEICNGDL